MFFALGRQYIATLFNGLSADVKAYISVRFNQLPRLIAAEVVKALVAYKEERLEPFAKEVLEDAQEAKDGVISRYPTLALVEPLLLDAVSKKISQNKNLAAVIERYGSFAALVGDIHPETLESLEQDIAALVANRLEKISLN